MKHFVSNSKRFFWKNKKNKAAFYASAFSIVIKFSIVCRKLSEEEKTTERQSERKKLQGERIVIIKTCTHKRNVNSQKTKINFASLLCVPFLSIQTISIVHKKIKKFKSPEKDCLQKTIFLLYVSTSFKTFLASFLCMQWCLAHDI